MLGLEGFVHILKHDWTVPSTGVWRHVVWQIFADVLDERAVSIFRGKNGLLLYPQDPDGAFHQIIGNYQPE
jgi:hypothetical protein